MKTIAILSSLLFACGGAVADIDGGADAATDSNGGDTSLDHDELVFTCGTSECQGDQAVCVHPCCGGAMLCAPLEDAGTCPQGLTISQQCPPEMPCSNVCTPPPPYCGTTKDCSMGQGHDCYLLCQ